MKKIYSFIAITAITGTLSAQTLYTGNNVQLTKSVTKSQDMFSKPATAVATDTVGWTNTTDFIPPFSPSNQLSIFGLIDANNNRIGYIYGKNTGGISICAQAYYNLNVTPLVITKALLWAALKNSTNSASTASIGVSIYDMANNKANSTTGTSTVLTQTYYGPNASKGSTTVSYQNVDTTSNGVYFTVATFATPVNINGDFAIVADCNTLAAGDTVCWLSDATGDAAGIDMTFHKANNGKWYVTDGGAFDDGALNNDIAFFAVLGAGTAVNEYYNGVKLSDVFPNPATDNATIQYTLEKEAKNVSFIVYDMQGKKVYEEPSQDMPAGSHTIKINTSSLNAGSYFYQLRANGANLTKEFIVTK